MFLKNIKVQKIKKYKNHPHYGKGVKLGETMKLHEKYPTLIPSIILSIMLILAIPRLFPYGYYRILRWIVLGGSIYISFKAYETKRIYWIYIFAFIAILFNPLAPIYLKKNVWIIIDTITAIVILISIKSIRAKKKVSYKFPKWLSKIPKPFIVFIALYAYAYIITAQAFGTWNIDIVRPLVFPLLALMVYYYVKYINEKEKRENIEEELRNISSENMEQFDDLDKFE